MKDLLPCFIFLLSSLTLVFSENLDEMLQTATGESLRFSRSALEMTTSSYTLAQPEVGGQPTESLDKISVEYFEGTSTSSPPAVHTWSTHARPEDHSSTTSSSTSSQHGGHGGHGETVTTSVSPMNGTALYNNTDHPGNSTSNKIQCVDNTYRQNTDPAIPVKMLVHAVSATVGVILFVVMLLVVLGFIAFRYREKRLSSKRLSSAKGSNSPGMKGQESKPIYLGHMARPEVKKPLWEIRALEEDLNY